MRKTHLTILGILVAVLAATAAVAQGDATPSSAVPAKPVVADPYVRAATLFGPLRGPVAELPKAVARGVPAGGNFGLDPSKAVAVPAPVGEKDTNVWYIVPGTKGVCLALPAWGVCSTYEQIETYGSLWFLTPGKNPKGVSTDDPQSEQAWVARGLAVDGAASIVASGSGRGTTGSADIKQNAFYLELPHGGNSVALKSATGKVLHEEYVGQNAG